jgi:beta-lactamase regulating signal transducer with metallopeptidase domain
MIGPFSLAPQFCVWLTLALVHFLWQGLLVAALACAAAWWLRKSSPERRHRVYAAALALMLACFPATFGLAYLLDTADPGGAARASAAGRNAAPGVHSTGAADPVAGFGISEAPGSVSAVPQLARWTTAAYLLGVCIMFGRLLLAWRGGWRMRRDALPLDDPALLAAVKRLAEQLGLAAAPLVAYCDRVAVPAVVGIFWPAILLPVTLASGLAPGQIELVIAHELAHIRRWDHLIILAQRITESVLFFHPAVWYLSHRLSIERELCCDQMVVSGGVLPSDYAETLLRVVESCRRPKHRLPEAALAMTSGRGRSAALVHRVLCILGRRSGSPVRPGRWWSIGLASTIVLATALGVWFRVRSARAEVTAEDARLVRLIASHELTALHWKQLEADEAFRPTIDALWNDLLPENGIGASWTARFLPGAKDTRFPRGVIEPPLTLTDFEKEALARIDQGEAEILRKSDSGIIQYVRPISARESCATLCHPEANPGMRDTRYTRIPPRMKEGYLLGIISIEIAPTAE